MKNKYKVIIVGAGPSGLSAALNLKNLGITDILVIEKGVFPRYKCCAGYITNKTKKEYEKLGLKIEECHYSLIANFEIFYKLKSKQTIENKFLYTNSKIDRVELDDAFFKLAKSRDIEILENTQIVKDDLEKKNITLTNGAIVEFDYLIFADGTFGYGSKYQNLRKKNIAMQVTFPSDRDDSIEIHFGITKRGYGWISTNDGTTNVGLTDVYDEHTDYKEIFESFLKDNELECDTSKLRGAFTPIGIQKPVIEHYIYYVGDALGACDPLTLSGLRYGLKSGYLCAKAISEDNQSIFKRYAYNLKFRFRLMSLLQSIFYLKSTLFLIFNVGCRFLSSFISYVFNHFFINKK